MNIYPLEGEGGERGGGEGGGERMKCKISLVTWHYQVCSFMISFVMSF